MHSIPAALLNKQALDDVVSMVLGHDCDPCTDALVLQDAIHERRTGSGDLLFDYSPHAAYGSLIHRWIVRDCYHAMVWLHQHTRQQSMREKDALSVVRDWVHDPNGNVARVEKLHAEFTWHLTYAIVHPDQAVQRTLTLHGNLIRYGDNPTMVNIAAADAVTRCRNRLAYMAALVNWLPSPEIPG